MSDRVTDSLQTGATLKLKMASLSREALYELVWSKPMLQIAEEIGVSSSYLARVCTEMRVPRPARGYWTQRELGKAPEQPMLPPERPGDVTKWEVGSSIGTLQRTAKKAECERPISDPPQTESRKRGRPKNKPENLGVHRLLRDVRPLFLKSRPSDSGLLQPSKRMLVDIVTSEALLDAALTTANGLFNALAARGHQVVLGQTFPKMKRLQLLVHEVEKKNNYTQPVWGPDRPTIVYVKEMPLGLTMFETTEDVECVYVDGSYMPLRDLSAVQKRLYTGPRHWTTNKERPTGRLCLQAYCPISQRVKWVKRWKENTAGELRRLLPSIVEELEAAVPVLVESLEKARIEQQEERRQWEEQQRRWEEQRERERQAKAHQDARQELMAAISAWDEARKIAAYFAEVVAAAEASEGSEREVLLDRVTKAQELVGEVSALESLVRWKSPRERLEASQGVVSLR